MYLTWLYGDRVTPIARRAVLNIAQALFNKVDSADVAPPVADWPQWVRDLMLDPYKRYEGRYRLMRFLYRNAIPANLAWTVLTWWNVPGHPGWKIMNALTPHLLRTFDTDAIRDISEFHRDYLAVQEGHKETPKLARLHYGKTYDFAALGVI
jgi:hypothetical protein